VKIKIIIQLAIILIATSCNKNRVFWDIDEDSSISLVRLIATPNDYHNEKIRVEGFLHLEFEENAIYLHKEDYQHGLTTNGFWVSYPDSLAAQMKAANDKYVLIEGTFDNSDHGHMGLFGGKIKEVTRVMVTTSY
jgi:hypothetical protein